MPHFIKTGNWDLKRSGSKNELSLEKLISTISPIVNLTAGDNILITGTYPNLTISSTGGGGSVWGLVTGILTNQTDLTSYLSTNYTPSLRTLNINGNSLDLSVDRSWSVGTVTSFSSGNLSPLFTTSVSASSLTPALSFSLSNAGANTWFGNNSGISTTPSYNSAGNLSEVTSSILTIIGNNTLLSNTTIQVKKSSTSQDGYLSSTDWNTFNNKLSISSLGSNWLTALTTNLGSGWSTALNTDSPSLIAGTNISITGSWPNSTISVSGLSGGSGFTVFNLN